MHDQGDVCRKRASLLYVAYSSNRSSPFVTPNVSILLRCKNLENFEHDSDSDFVIGVRRPGDPHRGRISSESEPSSSEHLEGVRSRRRTGVNRKYSKVQKVMFFKLYEEGRSIKDAATVAGIHVASAYLMVTKYKREGVRGGSRRISLTPHVLAEIEKIWQRKPSKDAESNEDSFILKEY